MNLSVQMLPVSLMLLRMSGCLQMFDFLILFTSSFRCSIFITLDSGRTLGVYGSSGNQSSVSGTFERNSETFICNLDLHA